MSKPRVAVIGAGVVGLACAERLARAGHEVVVLERHAQFGQETSSRNSEVIHAGLYYPPGTLKARSCAEGRARLYAFCREHGLAHRQIGKLVVAVEPAEEPALEHLYATGCENGGGALRLLGQAELRELEPQVRGVSALWSPETGIVDSHAVMSTLSAQARTHGATFVYRHELTAVEHASALRLSLTNPDGEREQLEVDVAVNCAGLHSDRVAALSGVDVHARALRLYPCKGDYFTLSSRLAGLVRHLVYPIAHGPGLGIHVTHDLNGGLRAGPDAEYVETPRYDVHEDKRALFGAALRRYLPNIKDDELTPAYAGVRPKLAGPGAPFRDFVCERFAEAPRVLQLIGIESPGLTAALALAEQALSAIAET